MPKKREPSKSERIKSELAKLTEIYKGIPENKKTLVEGLLNRAVYMRATLEDYEKDIDENGSVEQFSQSADVDPYERARPVVQMYNTMNKNYQSIIKQLADQLPPEETNNKDELEMFLSGSG